jgi:predicted DNA binding CopG/RHH family protein
MATKTESKSNPKQVTSLRLSDLEIGALRKQAKREGLSVSDLIRRCIDEALDLELQTFFTTE